MLKFVAVATLIAAVALGEVAENSVPTVKKQTVSYHISIAIHHKNNGTYSHWCSGSIISNEWIVSAASCFDKRLWPNKNTSLVIRRDSDQLGNDIDRLHGEVNLNDFNSTIYYDWYTLDQWNSSYNDLMLIKVSKPFEFGATLQPVPLYDQDEEAIAGSNGIVSGWTSNLNVSIMTKYKCNVVRTGMISYAGQICAAYEKPGEETSCPIQSDTGSPLTINGRLAGILSWNMDPCAASDVASIYAEVGFFRDWIRSKTGV